MQVKLSHYRKIMQIGFINCVTIQLTSAGLRVARINLKEIIAVAFVASFRVVALVHAITDGFTFVDVLGKKCFTRNMFSKKPD